ncbi:MAG: YggU family protein [Phycisphaerae bacterium]|nr:YggU family protein [Phycisphaerae bacterium]
MSKAAIQQDSDGVLFTAKIVPGSSRTTVAGVLADMVKIRVAAPPEKGKANECLIAFLAQQLGVKKNAVTILAGQTNPVKQVHIAGVSRATLLEKLGLGE